MTVQLSGVIHGKTIQLDSDPGLADGQVLVVVLPKSAPVSSNMQVLQGDAIDDDDLESEKHFQEIHQGRKMSSRREIPQ